MKVGSLKGFALLTGAMLLGLALSPFVRGFGGNKSALL